MEKGKEEYTSSSSSSKNSIEEVEETKEKACDYEQQRLLRIRENRARLEALGLPSLASSILGSSSSSSKRQRSTTKKKKKKGGDDDEEYRPSDDDDEVDRGGDDDDDEGVGDLDGSRVKGKKTSSSNTTRAKKISVVKRNREDFDKLDDDAALQLAISLSLGGTMEDSAATGDTLSTSFGRDEVGSTVHAKNDKVNMKDTTDRKKNRKMNKSRIQLTEDEVIAYFFSFDGAGKGHISLGDLQRMVLAYDFSWTEMEVASMISSFDSDRDGKLSLEDFRTIVSRCNMIQEAGNV